MINKVAVAQINSKVGDIKANVAKIKDYITNASKQGCEMLVFPEATITGYVCQDLFYDISFVKNNLIALEEIASFSDKFKEIIIILGFIDIDDSKLGRGGKARLYNCGAVINDGKVLSKVKKRLLPSYDIFDERRYFETGDSSKCVTVKGIKIGLGVCEDLWAKDYEPQVYQELISEKPDILVNISASPFYYGKLTDRLKQIEFAVGIPNIPFIYSNLVGGFDGYDGEVLFDGRSLIYNSVNKIVAVGDLFKEQLVVSDLSKDSEKEIKKVIIDEMYEALIFGVKEYFARCGLKKAIVGLSGGIDSALVVSLCAFALGEENVIGVTMPSHITSNETKNDALSLAENLGIKCDIRPIVSEYNAWIEEFKKLHSEEPKSLTKQNKQARIRGSILMEYANQIPESLVITAGNKTEIALGYCTLYGDMCGGLALISDVNKHEVYELSRYINKKFNKEIIPHTTIERAPTAELEEGQTDAKNLPADYDIISPLVEELIINRKDFNELSKKYDPEIIKATDKLISIYEFKRRQAAPGVRISKKSFGIGRRVPITHGFNFWV